MGRACADAWSTRVLEPVATPPEPVDARTGAPGRDCPVAASEPSWPTNENAAPGGPRAALRRGAAAAQAKPPDAASSAMRAASVRSRSALVCW